MRERSCASAEDAALTGFPREHCRVVATRQEGDVAYVLLDTGPPGRPYLYGVNCVRRGTRWEEGASSNGPGWSQAGPNDRLGTWSLWGEAPAGSDMVRIEYRGQLRDEPVVNGAYLAVWWHEPAADVAPPRVVAVRVNGRWTMRAESASASADPA